MGAALKYGYALPQKKATTLKPIFYELSVFFFSTLLLMSFELLLQLFLHPYIWHMWTNSHIHKESKPKFLQLIFQTFDITLCECEAPPLPLSLDVTAFLIHIKLSSN